MNLQAPGIPDEPYAAAKFRETSNDVGGAIGAAAVNDKDFHIAVNTGLMQQARQACADMDFLVERRNDRGNGYAISAYNFVSFFASLLH
jgi:hypothetical protein